MAIDTKKALLNKKGWTGDEVGRLMIADLVAAYKNALQGTEKGLLSDSDKTVLVNNLGKKEDIRAYNEYKYVHDFVVTVPMRYLMAQNMAEAAFWKLHHLLSNVRQAELQNRACGLEPRIVTQAEYDGLKKAGPARDLCVAVLQENGSTRPWIDESGNYKKPDCTFFRTFRAETLLGEYHDKAAKCIATIHRQYQEMYAYHVFLAIAGEFCDVDELDILIAPIDEGMIASLNDTFGLWKDIACAPGRDECQRKELIQGVKALLVPISIDALQPAEEDIFAAKSNMSFKTFQGYAAEFINEYLIAEDANP